MMFLTATRCICLLNTHARSSGGSVVRNGAAAGNAGDSSDVRRIMLNMPANMRFSGKCVPLPGMCSAPSSRIRISCAGMTNCARSSLPMRWSSPSIRSGTAGACSQAVRSSRKRLFPSPTQRIPRSYMGSLHTRPMSLSIFCCRSCRAFAMADTSPALPVTVLPYPLA